MACYVAVTKLPNFVSKCLSNKKTGIKINKETLPKKPKVVNEA